MNKITIKTFKKIIEDLKTNNSTDAIYIKKNDENNDDIFTIVIEKVTYYIYLLPGSRITVYDLTETIMPEIIMDLRANGFTVHYGVRHG